MKSGNMKGYDIKSSSYLSVTYSEVTLDVEIYTVVTESIQTPLNFSLFVILQPFAKII